MKVVVWATWLTLAGCLVRCLRSEPLRGLNGSAKQWRIDVYNKMVNIFTFYTLRIIGLK